MARNQGIRTVPFGHPPKGNAGHENEVLNPGRFQYGPKSTMGYYSSGISGVADPYTFVWWDELFRLTPEDGEEDDSDSWFINRQNTWQSGPSVNDPVMDNALPKAGYWTKKGGPHSNSDKNDGGFQMLTAKDRPKLLYNMGHENVASQGGSAETNVIGWDGYISADKQGTFGTVECNIGVPHAYAMYTLDMSPEVLEEVKAIVQDWLDSLENGTTFTPPTDERLSHVEGVLNEIAQTNTRSLSVAAIKRILKILQRVINMMTSQGVVGGLIVDWDFIAELKIPTEANEYILPPDQDQQLTAAGRDLYRWGDGGPFGPRRFSYTVDPALVPILFLCQMRANGMLWHLSSLEGGSRTRILRTTNFAHIHALSSTIGLNSGMNKRFRQVLSHWDEKTKPDSILDKTRRIDTRG